MKKLIRKAKVLTLREPEKIPYLEDINLVNYIGEEKEIYPENLFYITMNSKNDFIVIPYSDLAGKYYFKPTIAIIFSIYLKKFHIFWKTTESL